VGQDLLGKPLIEGHKHRPKILRAPFEIHSTTEKFLSDRDRFSKFVRLLIMEPPKKAPNLDLCAREIECRIHSGCCRRDHRTRLRS
jgi:hypothetical protein